MMRDNDVSPPNVMENENWGYQTSQNDVMLARAVIVAE